MSVSISSLANSGVIVNNADSSSASGTEELTEEQKSKIAQIEADYAAKLITKSEEEQKIAEVKASGVKRKKSSSQQPKSNSVENTKGTDSADESAKSREGLLKV